MKSTLKIVFSFALVAAVVLAMAAPAFASDRSLPRVEGEVGFVLNGARTFADFNVRATGAPVEGENHAPATGTFTVKTKGLRYTAQIDHIHAHSATEAHFGGMITKSSDPSMIGKFVHVVAVDGGTPGRDGDAISVVVTDSAAHVAAAAVPVTSGNLVVRAN